MPKVFRFFITNELTTEKILNSQRCEGHNKSGQRCKRKCIIGYEYCPTHLKSEKDLKIKDSTIPNSGKGVFVDNSTNNNEIVFRKDDKICDYNGIKTNKNNIDNEYRGKTAPYALQINNTDVIDAAGKRGVGSIINTKPGDNNCSFSIDNRNKSASVKATKNIKNGQELFLAYSRSYKLNEPDVDYYTKNYYPRKKR